MKKDPNDLHTTKQRILTALEAGNQSIEDLEEAAGRTSSTIKEHIYGLQDMGYEIGYDTQTQLWSIDNYGTLGDNAEADDQEREDLLSREKYIYASLPSSTKALAKDLEISKAAVKAHLGEIVDKGWVLETDGEGNWLAKDQEHLRNSEHKTTRTRKANQWWQKRHDQMVHDYRKLEPPRAEQDRFTGREDWIVHMTDLHAGDFVRKDDGRVIYETALIPDIVDFITERSLKLSKKHGSIYDTAHLLWGGDFITNEGIYEGQYEDLDAWLDEQHEILVEPLMRQIKAYAEAFPVVNIVCQIGNHGRHRASGVSKQANADLVLYKHIRNTVAAVNKYADGALDNVNFIIGEAKPYRNFEMRGGEIKAHLRHGQNRKPQAITSAHSNKWRGTYMDHLFDVCYAGHHHISGRVPWDGPPIFFTGSPKPAGEFVEKISGRSPRERQDMATCNGVSDDGVTGVYPIDSRGFGGENAEVAYA